MCAGGGEDDRIGLGTVLPQCVRLGGNGNWPGQAMDTVGHPLAMDVEAMRRTGYAAVDALAARLANPDADPVLHRASPAEMRALLGGPPPERGAGLDVVLGRVLADVLPYAARTNHPGYLAFIPYFTTWPA